ncbi:uncharacterized protein EAF02_007557 [Botrytis sinoallii]|uniref:uncharacterized protein n=1 Tax=Botrytis sinoallii TaxID=1463999 RepID=UPI0018FF166B|nr:uncharacterized protein EAF02_007557 [Botrytis sinoallii]KAF7879920.1 hypothetical protein EAF02_007557 [Botrytis sinoallii]
MAQTLGDNTLSVKQSLFAFQERRRPEPLRTFAIGTSFVCNSLRTNPIELACIWYQFHTSIPLTGQKNKFGISKLSARFQARVEGKAFEEKFYRRTDEALWNGRQEEAKFDNLKFQPTEVSTASVRTNFGSTAGRLAALNQALTQFAQRLGTGFESTTNHVA